MDKSQAIILRLAMAATALAVLLFPIVWIDGMDSGHVRYCLLPMLAWHSYPDEEWFLSSVLVLGTIISVWVVAAIASIIANVLLRDNRKRKTRRDAV